MGTSLLRRFRSEKRWVAIVTLGPFRKRDSQVQMTRRAPKMRFKDGICRYVTFRDENYKNGRRVVTLPHVEARHKHGI